MEHTDTDRHIVVGVDGSEPSRAALALAVDEARYRSARLLAVHTWTTPVMMGLPEYAEPVVPQSELRAAAHDLLDHELRNTPSDVAVDRRAVEGPAAATLIDLSADAELVVVGSRGRGGFAGLLLGSTSHQLASHARCPVVVVPPGALDEATQPAA